MLPDINMFGHNCSKNTKIDTLLVKKLFYVIDIIFWHILAKLKKKSSERFFRKVPKTPKLRQILDFSTFLAFCYTRLKLKNAAV